MNTHHTRRGSSDAPVIIFLVVVIIAVGAAVNAVIPKKQAQDTDPARQALVAQAVERARVYEQQTQQARIQWEAALPKTGQRVLFEGHPATVLGRLSVNPQLREATFRLRVTMPAGYSEVTAFLNEVQIQAEKPR